MKKIYILIIVAIVILLGVSCGIYYYSFKPKFDYDIIYGISQDDIEIKEIYLGYTHVIVEDTEGKLYACGNNKFGQLGIGNNQDMNYLVKIDKTELQDPKAVIAGKEFTIVVARDGTVWGTGCNNNGELGTGDNKNLNSFEQIFKTTEGTRITNPNKIITSNGFIFVEDSDGNIWATGKNDKGQLCLGNKLDINILTKIEFTMNGKEIKNPNKIELGDDYTIIENNDGIVYGAGSNRYQCMFLDFENRDYLRLVEISQIGTNPKIITAGFKSTIVEKSDGTIVGSGQNGYGELPGNSVKYEDKRNGGYYSGGYYTEDFRTPSGELLKDVKSIECRSTTTLIETNDGDYYVCGYNYGTFGSEKRVDSLELLNDVSDKKFEKINKVYLGDNYTIVKDKNNQFWGAGKNRGQLGDGVGAGRYIKYIKFATDRQKLYYNYNDTGEMHYEVVNYEAGVDTSSSGIKRAEDKGYYYVVICMGEKRTGGYSIKVKDVIIDGRKVEIHVETSGPQPGEAVTQAFTYPSVTVRLDLKPTKVKVIYD